MNVLTFDIEHSAGIFGPWLPGFVLSCLGYRCRTGAFVQDNVLWFDHNNPPNKQFFSESWQQFQELVDNADLIVGHNLKHDMKIARWCGGIDFKEKKLWDTKNSEYILAGQDPDRQYSMEAILRYRGLPEKHLGINEYWDTGIKTEDIPWEMVQDRVLSDVEATEAIYFFQDRESIGQQIRKIIELHNEYQHSLTDMEVNGLLIDQEKGLQLYLKEQAEVRRLEAELKEIFGYPELNLLSGDQLSAALYGGECKVSWTEWVTVPLKNQPATRYYEKTFDKIVSFPGIFTPLKRTELKKKGFYKTDKVTLSQLKARDKTGRIIKDKIQELSEHAKAMETLKGKSDTSGLLNKVGIDGKVHTEFFTAFTTTGRLSSRNPNGQNFPRESTSPIKQIIVPSLDFILQWDLSQIEWRGAAWLSRDRVMMFEINSGIDQHIAACKDLMELKFVYKSDPESKKNRNHAKVFNFRMIYGGSYWGFFLDPKMPRFSKSKWKAIVKAFFEKYFGLKQWQDNNIKLVWANDGVLVLPTGRKFKFVKSDTVDGVPVYPENCIKNYPVQGIAGADILPLACVIIRRGMRKLGLKSKLILTVHDSIVIDVLKEELDKLVKLLKEITNRLTQYISNYFEIDWDVNLDGEIEVGRSYGEMEVFK